MNRDVQISLKFLLLVLLGIYPEVKFLNRRIVPCLILWSSTILLFIAAVPFYIPTNGAPGFQIPYNLVNTCYLLFCWTVAILTGVG
jgi:hypothetical protein